MRRFLKTTQRVIARSLEDDLINLAKAAAYSGMLMLFPAMLVGTLLLSLVQEGTTLAGAMRGTFDQFLPADTLDLIQSYVLSRRAVTGPLIVSATCLSLFAGLGVMLSLMEGFRRAYGLPQDDWGFWPRRLRALLLVPIALVPLSVASLAIVFGQQIEHWMIANARHELRHVVIFFWRMGRWLVALITSTAVMSALYHFGTRHKEHWTRVAPGAITGTLIWFPATLAYGWYVTRVANYSLLYGSFGAGIATLVWLYLTSFSVLVGAELNGLQYGRRQRRRSTLVAISSPDGPRIAGSS
jgi:membrane protein